MFLVGTSTVNIKEMPLLFASVHASLFIRDKVFFVPHSTSIFNSANFGPQIMVKRHHPLTEFPAARKYLAEGIDSSRALDNCDEAEEERAILELEESDVECDKIM